MYLSRLPFSTSLWAWKWRRYTTASPPLASHSRTRTTSTKSGTSQCHKATGSNSTSPISAWSLPTSVNMTSYRYICGIKQTKKQTFIQRTSCSHKSFWPCQSRFLQRGTKPCGSAARETRTMKAAPGIPLSCQPGTSCQWSLGVTTLTRADSLASKHFTPQKVMQNRDVCCQRADIFLVVVSALNIEWWYKKHKRSLSPAQFIHKTVSNYFTSLFGTKVNQSLHPQLSWDLRFLLLATNGT